jgi:glutathione S-transferase
MSPSGGRGTDTTASRIAVATFPPEDRRTMRLYITPGSPYARIARIMVLEKGLENRIEIVVARTRTMDSPYYRINPSGRVPYLVRDDGVGLEESAVVCRYLDHLDGNPEFDLPEG